MSDRFIPSRLSNANSDLSHFMLSNNFSEQYLADALGGAIFGPHFKKRRILSYINQKQANSPVPVSQWNSMLPPVIRPSRMPKLHFETKHEYRILDSTGVEDNFYMNILDWSSKDMLATGVGTELFIIDNQKKASYMIFDVRNSGTDSKIASVSMSEDGDKIITTTTKGKAFLHDLRSDPDPYLTIQEAEQTPIYASAWNGNTFALGLFNGKTHIYDNRTKSYHVDQLQNESDTTEAKHSISLKFSPSKTMLAVGYNSDVAVIYDLRNFKPLTVFKSHSAAVKAIAWSESERNIIYTGGGTTDGTLKKWNATTGEVMSSRHLHTQICNVLYQYNDYLVVTRGYTLKDIVIVDAANMSIVYNVGEHDDRVLFAAFNHERDLFATLSPNGTLKFWDVFRDAKSRQQKKGKIDRKEVKLGKHNFIR